MNPRRCSNPLFAWREAVTDSVYGPQSMSVGGRTVTRRTQVAVAVTGLSLHMNERGSSCWPSVETLARETGMSERTVQRANAALVEQGYLIVVRGGGRGRTNQYAVRIPPKVKAALIASVEDASKLPDVVVGSPFAEGVLGPPFSDERVAVGPERVAAAPEKGVPRPPEVPMRSSGSRPDTGDPAGDVISMAAFLAARAAHHPDPPPDPVMTAGPPVWVQVWWWCRSRGDERTFPQVASGSPLDGETVSLEEYVRLEADWRAAGSPFVFDPRILTAGSSVKTLSETKEVQP